MKNNPIDWLSFFWTKKIMNSLMDLSSIMKAILPSKLDYSQANILSLLKLTHTQNLTVYPQILDSVAIQSILWTLSLSRETNIPSFSRNYSFNTVRNTKRKNMKMVRCGFHGNFSMKKVDMLLLLSGLILPPIRNSKSKLMRSKNIFMKWT